MTRHKLSSPRARSRLLGSLLLTIAGIPLERRTIQKLPAFSGPRIDSRSSRLSLRLPLRCPAARGLALGSMLWLRSVLRVRPRAISVPLTRNCTELAALDAICRGLSVCNYIRERFRIPLSPPFIATEFLGTTSVQLSERKGGLLTPNLDYSRSL